LRLAQQQVQQVGCQAQAPRALLLSLHRPDLLGGFDRAIGLRRGHLVFDQPVQAISTTDLQDLYSSHDKGAGGISG
jgi:phosphonate transport system ATP-binding protein